MIIIMQNEITQQAILESDNDNNYSVEYANKTMKIRFLNKKNIRLNNVKYLESTINRQNTIGKLNIALCDIESAFFIEAGLFEFTLTYSLINRIVDTLMPAIYNEKLNDILLCVNYIKKIILESTMNLQKIAFMSPQKMNPETWKSLIERSEIRENKNKNISGTDLYTCTKCGGKIHKIYQMQTRSADEPMTNFVTCLTCYHTFKG